ncbi:hypothetical protein AB6A40_007733 [Gnathostoma spinigerum]|uniref:START domain-containing protein n=1 Tax=Gnathostoma spinigerum TaxID=75299 RepID=A0ABD6ES83_9BILA
MTSLVVPMSNLTTNAERIASCAEGNGEIDNAKKSIEDLIGICSSPQFNTREDWEKVASCRRSSLYAKEYPFGRVYTLKVLYDFPMNQLFNEHWSNIEFTPTYNKNALSVKRIGTISPEVDLIQYIVSDICKMGQREFLMTRTWKKLGDSIFVALRSVGDETCDLHPTAPRSIMILGGARLNRHPRDPMKTVVDYIVCLDFNDSEFTKEITQFIISKFMMEDVEYTQLQLDKVRQNARRTSKNAADTYVF